MALEGWPPPLVTTVLVPVDVPLFDAELPDEELPDVELPDVEVSDEEVPDEAPLGVAAAMLEVGLVAASAVAAVTATTPAAAATDRLAVVSATRRRPFSRSVDMCFLLAFGSPGASPDISRVLSKPGGRPGPTWASAVMPSEACPTTDPGCREVGGAPSLCRPRVVRSGTECGPAAGAC